MPEGTISRFWIGAALALVAFVGVLRAQETPGGPSAGSVSGTTLTATSEGVSGTSTVTVR